MTDENGSRLKKVVTKSSNQVYVRAGDPNVTISGVHTYIIKYTVTNVLGHLSGYDEIYWNAIGGDWTSAIGQASVSFTVPGATLGSGNTSCFVGPVGTLDQSRCLVYFNGASANFFAKESLNQEYFTIKIQFPKGILLEPFYRVYAAKMAAFFNKAGAFIIPIAAFVGMFLLWFYKGRDPKGKGIIVPQYDPPRDIVPIEFEGILKEKSTIKSFPAETIYLATQGYLSIKRIEKTDFKIFHSNDYELTRLKSNENLYDFDSSIMNFLFGNSEKILLSDLKKANNAYGSGGREILRF